MSEATRRPDPHKADTHVPLRQSSINTTSPEDIDGIKSQTFYEVEETVLAKPISQELLLAEEGDEETVKFQVVERFVVDAIRKANSLEEMLTKIDAMLRDDRKNGISRKISVVKIRAFWGKRVEDEDSEIWYEVTELYKRLTALKVLLDKTSQVELNVKLLIIAVQALHLPRKFSDEPFSRLKGNRSSNEVNLIAELARILNLQ